MENKTYQIEWLYTDEQGEQDHRYSNIGVFYSDTPLGKQVDEYLQQDEPDFVALDQALDNAFGLKDDDFVYYIVDPDSEDLEALKQQLYDENDMVVYEIEQGTTEGDL